MGRSYAQPGRSSIRGEEQSTPGSEHNTRGAEPGYARANSTPELPTYPKRPEMYCSVRWSLGLWKSSLVGAYSMSSPARCSFIRKNAV